MYKNMDMLFVRKVFVARMAAFIIIEIYFVRDQVASYLSRCFHVLSATNDLKKVCGRQVISLTTHTLMHKK